jgi:nickel-dependent lactate racemase
LNLPPLPFGPGALPAPAAARRFDLLDRPFQLPPLSEAGLDGELEAPLGAAPLAELARGARRVHLIVPDGTRASGAAELVAAALRALHRGGVSPKRVAAVFALGLHRPPTQAERASVLGAWSGRLAIVDGRPDEEGDRLDRGFTSLGTPILLSRRALEADLVVLVGSIGFHYFAGFTGGRKAILPGIAAAESIRANHLRVLGEAGAGRDPRVRPGALDGNPVHLDMDEAASRVEPGFLFNSVVGDDGRIVAAFAGHWRQAHRAGCEWVAARRAITVAEPRPIVIASAGGHPRDLNLIQAHKALEHAQAAVAPGGVLVLAAACGDGVGDPSFGAWMRWRDDLGEFQRRLRSRYEVYGQTAFALAVKLARFRIVLVSRLPHQVAQSLGLVPARDLDEALERARQWAGDQPGWWIPHAGSVLIEGAARAAVA